MALAHERHFAQHFDQHIMITRIYLSFLKAVILLRKLYCCEVRKTVRSSNTIDYSHDEITGIKASKDMRTYPVTLPIKFKIGYPRRSLENLFALYPEFPDENE